MSKCVGFSRRLRLSLALHVAGFAALGLAPLACGPSHEASQSDGAPLLDLLQGRDGVFVEAALHQETPDSRFSLLGIDAPSQIRPGQTFTIRTYLNNYAADRPEQLALAAANGQRHLLVTREGTPSPIGAPAPIAVDMVLTLSPQATTIAGQQLKLHVFGVGPGQAVGQAYPWTVTILDEAPQVCVPEGLCGPRVCGLDPVCGTECGGCNPGLVCSYQGTCEPVGSACPELSQCTDRVCGLDPICGRECGLPCGPDLECDPSGHCVSVDDSTATETASSEESSSSTTSSSSIPSSSSTSSSSTTTSSSTSSDPDGCPMPGQISCDDVCIDPNTDTQHCGARDDCAGLNTGAKCEATQVCANGTCQDQCPQGHVVCDELCIDPTSDPKHCGAKFDCEGMNVGKVCPEASVCAAGICKLECPADKIICEGRCIDPDSDVVFCGAKLDCREANSGEKCNADEVCADGVCAIDCPSQQIECAGKCVTPTSDESYCGAKDDCMGTNSGVACSSDEVCNAGKCQLDCDAGEVKCDDTCVNPKVDPDHCGAGDQCLPAGTSCRLDELCYNGACIALPNVWLAPKVLLTGLSDASGLATSKTPTGDTFALWQQAYGAHSQAGTVAQRLPNGTATWSGETWLNETGGLAYTLDGLASLQAAGPGKVVAAWAQTLTDPLTPQVVASVFNSGEWSEPSPLRSPATSVIGSARVAGSGDGSAMVVWLERNLVDGKPIDTVMGAVHASMATSWGTALVLREEAADLAVTDREFIDLQAIADADGDVTVVWIEKQESAWSLWSTRCTEGTCDPAQAIPEATPPLAIAQAPVLSVRNDGTVVAAWQQIANDVPTIWAARYPQGAANFSKPDNVSNDYPGHYGQPSVASFASQTWIALAKIGGGVGELGPLAVASCNFSGCAPANDVALAKGGSVREPALAFNKDGHLLVVWIQDDEGPKNRVYANLYDARRRAFGQAVRLDDDDNGDARRPQVSTDATGAFIVLWEQSNGSTVQVRWTRGVLRKP